MLNPDICNKYCNNRVDKTLMMFCCPKRKDIYSSIINVFVTPFDDCPYKTEHIMSMKQMEIKDIVDLMRIKE